MENETVADIVAQIRAVAYIQNADKPRSVLHLADRIEAAWKREAKAIATENAVLPAVCITTNQSGNAAAMRDALLQVALSCLACPRHNCKGCTRPFASFMLAVRKALSAPPRNCDVGTAEEQAERYHATGEVYHTLTLTNALEWAQMPYEADADKKGE